MKKRLIILSSLLLVIITGCKMASSPSKKVEEFFGKYQSMDSEVLAQLDNIVANDKTMTDEQKKEYKTLMEKQYQNISYKIKNEEVNGNDAIVEVEIEVYDYITSINKSKEYYENHKEEFEDNDKDNEVVGGVVKETVKYIDYKIKQLKDVTDKVKYNLVFNLHRENSNSDWKLEDISDIDREKIHGLYEE